MCGIAGYWGSRDIARENVEKCLALMQRRGPDFKSFFHDSPRAGQHVYLLHSRLNIIDFDERSNQPFTAGGKTIVYNGELYNYLEVKERLKAAGGSFNTEGDTEVFIQGLARNTWRALDDYEGMWAFALYDRQDGSLLLGRDRFGEKPLFMYRDATGIYFGSEIKFITALSGGRLPVNYQQLHRYLINGYRSLHKTHDTFFENVSVLPAATLLSLDNDGNEKSWRYWNPSYVPDETITFDEAVVQAREALVKSVQIRLRADVPLAFCLSGGIDSNAIISIAKKVLGYDVHGFTVISSDPRFDEREMVSHSVAELGIRYTPVHLSPNDFLPNLRKLVRQHDAPVYFVAYYPQWLLMGGVADAGYRVVVSGTAADEIFCGYYDHHLAYLREIHGEEPLYSQSVKSWKENVLPIIRNPFWRNPDLYVDSPELRHHLYFDGVDFSGYLNRAWSEPFTEEKYTESFLRNRTMNEIFHETTPGILNNDDLNAMYFSLENRSPFLDKRLFEFMHKVPTRHLIRNGYSKAILREAVRGIVPDIILNNYYKTGFNASILELLDVKDPDVRGYLLDDSKIFELIRKDRIEKLMTKDHLPTSESKFLFSFLNSKIFLEEFA